MCCSLDNQVLRLSQKPLLVKKHGQEQYLHEQHCVDWEHPVLADPLRLEVWGYTNEVRLRGLYKTRAGGFSLYSRDFQSPGVSSKSGCSPYI